VAAALLDPEPVALVLRDEVANVLVPHAYKRITMYQIMSRTARIYRIMDLQVHQLLHCATVRRSRPGVACSSLPLSGLVPPWNHLTEISFPKMKNKRNTNPKASAQR
jgi:hypothetical protein